MSNLSYSYEDLIQKSSTILDFSTDFSKELDCLSSVVKDLNTNFQTPEAIMVYKSLDIIRDKEDMIKKSLDNFALAIRDEIAPTYKKIEDQATDAATSIYGG